MRIILIGRLPMLSRLLNVALRGFAQLWATGCLFSLAIMLAAGIGAGAQDYPNRLIRAYMGYPAGTYLDIVTRHFTDRLAQLCGQTVIVENKVGASGMM